MAVNGVRSSWEATAAKSRADSSAALVRCCSSPMRASIPSTASAISTASCTPRTCTSSGLDCALIARACCASSRKGLIMIDHITQPTRTVPMITPPQINNTRRCSSLMRSLRFGERRTHRDHRVTGGEGADPVLHAVDRGVRVADVEFRQHHFAGHRHRDAVDAGGAHQIAVGRLGLIACPPAAAARSRVLMSPKTAHRIEPPVQLAVLVVRHAEPHPRAERDHQRDDRKRGDDDDDAQRQHRVSSSYSRSASSLIRDHSEEREPRS